MKEKINCAKGLILYFKDFDYNKRIIYLIDENSNFQTFFVKDNFFFETNGIFLINYVFKEKRNSKNIIYIEKIKTFPDLNNNVEKVTIIELFYELFKFNEKNNLKYFFDNLNLFNFVENLTSIIEKDKNFNFLKYLIYILSIYLILEGYLNFDFICDYCGKSLKNEGIYLDIKHFLVRCKEHKTVYSYLLEKDFIIYLNNLQKKENYFILPELNNISLKKLITIFERLILNIREGKYLKIFKFINYLINFGY